MPGIGECGPSHRRTRPSSSAAPSETSTETPRADGEGVETPIAINDWTDVGVFGEKPGKTGKPEETVLYLTKHRITHSTTKIRLLEGDAV